MTYIMYYFQMSLNVLTKIANDSSLRYAIQLITPAALQAKRRNHKQVTTEDIRKPWVKISLKKSNFRMAE